MKNASFSLTVVLLLLTNLSRAQKTISEGTLVYDIAMQSAGKAPLSNGLNGATVTIYLKGTQSRTDMASSLGNEKTIYDAKTGSGIILKEYSGQKLMITLTKENWLSKNKKTDGTVFTKEAETKVIAGYHCGRAMAKLNDGSVITVFYTNDISVLNKEYDPAFKNLDGFPVQYEFESGPSKFVYTLSRIDLNSVPAVKFETPKSGYRVITYDENRQGKKE